MIARAAYILTRALCLCIAVTIVQPVAVAATYNSFQDLIINESLIAGYGTEAIEGYTARPNFILEKDADGNWFANSSVQYSLSAKTPVDFQVNSSGLVQTYTANNTSVSAGYYDFTSSSFADKWGQTVADQLEAALNQGILYSTFLQFELEIETSQATLTMVSTTENEMVVDIESQTAERLVIPQYVVDNIQGGWSGPVVPEVLTTQIIQGVKLEFGYTAATVPDWSEMYITLPFIANYIDTFGTDTTRYFQDFFWNDGDNSSSNSTILGQSYTLLKSSDGLTLSIDGNTFSYSFLKPVNESAWSVLVRAQMADTTEYIFIDEMVILDRTARDFADRLVSIFPFAQMAQINSRTTDTLNDDGLPMCDMLFGYVFNDDGTLSRGVNCSNNQIYNPGINWQWDSTDAGIEMFTTSASFESRARHWIPLTVDDNGITWVLEYSIAKLTGSDSPGIYIPGRINYIELVNLSDYAEEYRNGGFDGDNDGDGFPDSEDDDDDNDGMSDEYEAANGLNHLDGNDAAFDKDGDGLTNYSEFEQGTSPANADTDGDGVIDSVDGYPLDALRTDSTAELFSFSYTYDANERGTAGHVLQGIVEGYLMDDNDTIVISNLVSASLGGYDYVVTSDAAVRAADPADTPRMSLSGDELDFWVCVQGFTYTYDNGGGDCAFGPEGGFLISYYVDSNNGNCLEFSGSDCSVWAWAGIPDLGDSYRDGDIPVNRNNWSATTYSTTRVRNDVDGDGKSDLLWRSYAKGWNFLWTMDGAFMSSATPINVVASNEWDMVGQGDYDADGKSDIFWRNNTSGQNFVYLMDGPSIKSRYSLNYVTGGSWIVAGSGDFDGDGTGDVIWRNTARGDTWFYLMDSGYIGQSLPSLWVTDLNYQIAAVGDIDGDGDDDIIWRHNGNGVNYIWLMEGGAISSRYTLNTVNTQWSIAGAGDLDGDGTDDLIFRNQVDGENWVYYMDNGQVRESRLINTVADTNWQIANIGDYDGDGKVDFLWRDETTARNIIHLMNGTSIKGRGVLRNTNNTWRVAR